VTVASVEREVKLAVDAGFELPAVDGLVQLAEQRLRTVYVDAQDLRLARWGISLRCRTGEDAADARWTVKLPALDGGEGSDDGQALARTEVTVDAPASTVPDELAHLVRAHVRGALLVPVAVLESCRRRWLLPGVAEIDDDDVTVLDGERVVRCFRELEVELLPDADGAVASPIVERLVAAGARPAAAASKLAQALGDAAAAPPDVVVPVVGAKATLAEVARAAIASGAVRLLRHDPGVRLGDDIEDVHQARVATRRLRSDLQTFAAAFGDEPGGVAWLRDELRWIGGCLGEVRDADVLLERFASISPPAPAVPPTVVRRLQDQRAQARAALLSAMDGDRYVVLVSSLVDAANGRLLRDGPMAGRRASGVLADVVHAQWRRLRRAHKALGADPEDAALHELRIRAKRARYASEASAAVLGKPATRFAKALAGLQGVLGDFQDAVVAEAWLTGAAKASSPAVAFACGLLVARERAEQAAARRDWVGAWDGVVAARKRWSS
jgi:CHAD domain-containing protein